MFNYAVKHGYADENVVLKIEKETVVKEDNRLWTPEELAKVLGAAKPDLLPFIALAAFAGIRSGELQKLDWSDVNFAKSTVKVGKEKSKTAANRWINMEPNLVAWLRPYASAVGRIVPDGLYWKIGKACRAAGVQWGANISRHSYASNHYAKYQDAAKLAANLGHTSTKLIFSTYRDAVTDESAASYFSIMPTGAVSNVVEMVA